MKPRLSWPVLTLAALACVAADAPPPATRDTAPTTSPAATTVAEMAMLLKNVAAAEPDVRRAANFKLSGVAAADLVKLRQAAESLMPLQPAQVDALREAVAYIYTRAALQRLPQSRNAFMGVQLSESAMGEFPGVLVGKRIPGLVAARYLKDSDVILGFIIEGQIVWMRTVKQIITQIQQLQVGASVTLLVHRGSQIVGVTFPLDARPIFPDAGADPLDMVQQRLLTAAAEEAEQQAVNDMEMQFDGIFPRD